MYRLCAPQTVRAMLGQGFFIARTPSTSFPCISSPDTGSIIAGSIPKKGKDALPGLVGVTPASGLITWDPVSVCQYVYAAVQYWRLEEMIVGTYVHNVCFFLANNVVIPLPDFGSNGLTY